jgi:hypothetical protein
MVSTGVNGWCYSKYRVHGLTVGAMVNGWYNG